MRRSLHAAILAIAVAVATSATAVAQVNPVYKQDPVTGNATQQQQITVPSGFSDTYNPGSVLDCNGCTPTGFPFGSGNVTGPASATSGDLPDFSDATGKVLSDSGVVAANVVSGPSSATAGNVAEFNGATGKVLQNGPAPSVTVNGVSCSLGNACTAGRTILTANLTQHVSATGSDVTGDGSSGNPWATCAHAYAVDQTTYDINGFSILCSMTSGTYTAFCWSFNGPLVGQTTPAGFTIQGPGQFGSTLTGGASCGEFFAENGARITLTTANIQPGAAGFGMLVSNGEIDFSLLQLTDQGTGSNFGDVAGGTSQLSCVGAFELVSSGAGNVTNIFVAEDHGRITLNCALTMSGAPVWTTFVQGDLGGMVDGTGFTFTGGTPTGSRFAAISNGIVFTGGSGGANFYPGSTAGTTNTGGFYQ